MSKETEINLRKLESPSEKEQQEMLRYFEKNSDQLKNALENDAISVNEIPNIHPRSYRKVYQVVENFR